MSLVDDINRVLPQTQCGECGYKGCKPYAESLSNKKDTPNKCPPGGVKTLKALGKILNIDITKYEKEVIANTRKPQLAKIKEDDCVGCMKCITACPVDAIVGSTKLMHSIIEHECTGCGLCVEPCPVDCIEMYAVESNNFDKEKAGFRFQDKQIRELKERQATEALYKEKRKLAAESQSREEDKKAKQKYILEALLRSKR